MATYKDLTFDEERALYGSRGAEVVNCRFDGPADGESALKESRDITVKDSFFNLRYPFWHDTIPYDQRLGDDAALPRGPQGHGGRAHQ